MSGTVPAKEQPPAEQETQEKNTDDKKEIADEEREKMLNAENTKHAGQAPVDELETEVQKPKRKIPIGAIKMPGFCRSKSKEPCKDDETKPAEGADGETGKEADVAGNGSTPAKETKDKEAAAGTGVRGRNILQAIRAPLNNVFSRKKKETDAELGPTGQAGLASVETLDDAAQEKNNATGEDGMETVRLDPEAADGSPPAKPHPLFVCLSAARRNVLYSAAAALILLLVIIIICVACVGPRRIIPQPVKDGKVTTQTSCGLVQGLLEEDAFVFRGIPYAVPPVNNRRWQPSESLRKIEHCWNGTYLAHNSSQVCWQRNGTHNYGSEDCLYLDVYTPQVTYDRPLAVVVMIGADTLSGPSPGIMVPSGKLAHVREIVFVRPNFRLDAFGFLSVEPLSRAAHPQSSGNYGLSDIITVLQWVQLNIEHFGGDKTKVTLWGHRAGGTLVTSLVASRKANTLFARAWVSSGSAIFPTQELRDSEKQNEVFLDKIKCRDAVCLRNKNANDVMDAVPASWYTPNDGLPESREVQQKKHEWLVKDLVIIQQHVGAFLQSNKLPVKLVLGSTAQSGQLPRTLNYNSTEDPQLIKKFISESLLGTMGIADKALTQYNATIKGLHTMISDVRVVCPLYAVATIKSEIPFYISTFPRGVVADVDNDAAVILGFFRAKTPEQKRHQQAMQTLFDHFAWHGIIKDFEEGTKRVLIVDQDVLPQNSYENCKLWISEEGKNIAPAYGRID